MLNILQFKSDIDSLVKRRDEWQSSKEYNTIKSNRAYYNSNNPPIMGTTKQIYINVTTTDESGNECTNKKLVNNAYVANNKITDGFVQDMVDQKVYTLLENDPTFSNISDDTADLATKIIPFAEQEMGVECSIGGVAYSFNESDGTYFKIKIFDTEDCIAYGNLDDGLVEVLQRNQTFTTDNVKTEIIEVFEMNGYTKHSRYKEGKWESISSAYKSNVISDGSNTNTVAVPWVSGLPINVMQNNRRQTADVTRAITSKIDAIDKVMSDFENNLEDFQDIFWLLKGVDGAEAQELSDFMVRLKEHKIGSLPPDVDAEAITKEIPYQARKEFINIITKQLVANAGVIDMEAMTGGSLTNVAIKAAMQKLLLRVAKFEYYAYETAMQMLMFIKEFTGDTTADSDIKFHVKSINNDTETIDNLVKSEYMLSLETRLDNHPYVSDTQEELELIDAEKMGIVEMNTPVEEAKDDGRAGQSAQTDGQGTASTGNQNP